MYTYLIQITYRTYTNSRTHMKRNKSKSQPNKRKETNTCFERYKIPVSPIEMA